MESGLLKKLKELDLKNKLEDAKNQGLKEGIEKGREEGRREEKIEIATAMLANNLPIEQIASYTKLSEEEIDNLKLASNVYQLEEYVKKFS